MKWGHSERSAQRGVEESAVLAFMLFTLFLFTPAVMAQQAGYITTPDSARLFYRTVGRGTDTLIAIHGGPGVDLESIAGDFAPPAERHVVIFYDQRGTGRSAWYSLRTHDDRPRRHGVLR
jgi:hypothetical protein